MAAVRPGRIAAGRWRYQLTHEDLLWAGRMVEGETLRGRSGRARDALAILWTMASLFSPAGQRAKYGGRRFETFVDLIRAYSQPINPRWYADGAFCRPGGRNDGSAGCSSSKLDRRAQLRRMGWSEIDPGLRRTVIAWAKGETTNPVPKSIEFADGPTSASFIDRHPGSTSVARIHNTFIATANSRRWTELPDIQPASNLGVTIGVAIATVAAGSLAGWAWNHYRTRNEEP